MSKRAPRRSDEEWRQIILEAESRNRSIVESGTEVQHHRNSGSESPGILSKRFVLGAYG